MSETRFTPGPWGVDKDDPLIIVNKEGSSLGEMSAGDPYISFGEQIANARLAATSTELYAALDDLIDAVLHDFDKSRRLARAQAVLNKARGPQP